MIILSNHFANLTVAFIAKVDWVLNLGDEPHDFSCHVRNINEHGFITEGIFVENRFLIMNDNVRRHF